MILLIPAIFRCGSASIKSQEGDIGSVSLDTLIVINDRDRLERLIVRGAPVNRVSSLGLRPLHVALMNDNGELAGLLLKNGASVIYGGPYSAHPYPPNVLKWREEGKTFFLTFDLGIDDGNLDHILTVLKKYNIRATFFITGIFLKKYPGQVRRLVRDGHTAGNHTMTHTMYYYTKEHLVRELRANEELFREVTGNSMVRIWRSPGLQHIYRPWQVEAAFAAGYRHIDVSLLNLDYTAPGDERYIPNDRFMNIFTSHVDSALDDRYYISGQVYDYYSRRAKKSDYRGIIMLMHAEKYRAGKLDFVHVLEPLILHLIKKGYYFDTLERFGPAALKLRGL